MSTFFATVYKKSEDSASAEYTRCYPTLFGMCTRRTPFLTGTPLDSRVDFEHETLDYQLVLCGTAKYCRSITANHDVGLKFVSH
jgi:hypothetical protein